jgi:hypothetical protein
VIERGYDGYIAKDEATVEAGRRGLRRQGFPFQFAGVAVLQVDGIQLAEDAQTITAALANSLATSRRSDVIIVGSSIRENMDPREPRSFSDAPKW